MDVLRQIKANNAARSLFVPDERLLLAVSGGVDSMTLLAVFHRLAATQGWRLSVAHFNHCLRGAQSDDDEHFTRNTAANLGIPFFSDRGNVPEFQKSRGVSLEMAARHLRHEFLAGTARKCDCAKIVTAHHADDQVELFFLRLFRGAGVDGLGGMDWLSPSPMDPSIYMARPLLNIPKSALEAYAREFGIQFREDVSNLDTDILRNRVRARLLPMLTGEFAPALPQTIPRLMDTLRAEGEVVGGIAKSWLESKPPLSWKTLPLAVRRRCVLLQLLQLGEVPEFDLIESLCGIDPAIANGSQGIRLQHNGDGILGIIPVRNSPVTVEPLKLVLEGNAGEILYGPWRIEWRRHAMETGIGENRGSETEHFDAARVGDRLTIGYWSAGDRFQPIGMAETVKLQDLFVNLKIPRDQRHRLLVARTQTGEIFWVQGLRIGDAYKLDKTTKDVLTWKWHPRDA